MLGSPPPELEALLERCRQAGADLLDEVWEGIRHMVPAPSLEHARVASQLTVLLCGPVRAAGLLLAMHAFNLGESEHDFRVPDGALHRPGAAGVWQSTAAMVVEILSPGDESRAALDPPTPPEPPGDVPAIATTAGAGAAPRPARA